MSLFNVVCLRRGAVALLALGFTSLAVMQVSRAENPDLRPQPAISQLLIDAQRQSEQRQWLCLLAGAVNEAGRACEALSEDEPDHRYALCLQALRSNPLVHAGSYGELSAVTETIEFLDLYVMALSVDACDADELREARGYSEGDVRFLAGFVHWYLSTAWSFWRDRTEGHALISRASLHKACRAQVSPDELRSFKDMDYDELLGRMD